MTSTEDTSADDPSADGTGTTEDPIARFWEVARIRAGLGRIAVVAGPGTAATIAPPAWSFGDTPELADSLLGLVLEGRKTATSTALAEFEEADEALPVAGDLGIVLDGAGRPRALIRTTAVEVVPFAEVPSEHAAAEGEDDGSLASWRTEHERYFRRVLGPLGIEFSETMPVVLERFELRYGA